MPEEPDEQARQLNPDGAKVNVDADADQEHASLIEDERAPTPLPMDEALSQGSIPETPVPAGDELSDSGEDTGDGGIDRVPSVVAAMQARIRTIMVELKSIEMEVRKLLEDRDTKRKRKLAGTHRWEELREDVMALRFTGRVDEGTLQRLEQLVCRRNALFSRLEYLSATRPVWNS